MAEKTNYGKNMMLVKASVGNLDTFKMMPVTPDCPYSEVIYDPTVTLLVVIGKENKDTYHMVVKLDGDGHPTMAKRKHQDGNPYRQARERITVKQEYYITEKEEQVAFVNQFAVNTKEFDFEKMMRDLEKEASAVVTAPEAKPLVDDKGMAITPKK